MEKQKQKSASAVTAGILAAALAMTGTFAWYSKDQAALNEKEVIASNPGGRLHDDFNGENKDVYVENFGDQPIYARVKLDEYMELGDDAGKKKTDTTRKATSIVSGAKINDQTTWTRYKYGETNAFDTYWTHTWGGSTTYMPTFNKNKDSLQADINGTFANKYTDYEVYTTGKAKTDNAVYDIDDNDIDEGSGAVEGTNVENKSETHTAANTLYGTVMSLAEWKTAGSKQGNYWVYDTNGWAYWMNPIQPNTATGLLLTEITQKNNSMARNCYYAINVTGQFVTADSIGTEDKKIGWYSGNVDDYPTQDIMNGLLATWKDNAKRLVGSSKTITVDAIKWHVIDMDGDYALLWSAQSVDSLPYDRTGDSGPDGEPGAPGNSEWSTSSLRQEINSDSFINSKLPTLKSDLMPVSYNGSSNWVDSTSPEKVFILSSSEAKIIYDKNPNIVYPSNTAGNGWWLRSYGDYTDAYNAPWGPSSNCDASNLTDEYSVGETDDVRIAIWVDLNK